MAYTPIKAGRGVPVTSKTSLMAKDGLNLRELPQLLDVNYALDIQNYLLTSEGGLTKRGGLEKITCILPGDNVAASCEGYWRLDDMTGTTATDSSGNGRNGTISGSPPWVAGRIGNALEFTDNASEYVTIAHNVAFQSTDFSVSLWFKPTSTPAASRTLIGKNGGFLMRHEASARVSFYFWDGVDYEPALWSISTLQHNVWYNIVITYDLATSTKSIYINGVLDATRSGDPAYSPIGTASLLIGASVFGNAPGGLIDEVRYYGLALTEEQISYLNCSPNSITLFKQWTDDIFVVGYGKQLAAYSISQERQWFIKTNFVTRGFDGARYGDYFFVASPGDKINRISQELDYDGQTGNFTVGDVVTGGTSGATAIILEDADAGATGTLTLGNISGTFADNEALTDATTGVAVVNGELQYVATEITNAPKAKVLKAIDTRLYAGNLEGEEQAVQYSEVDDGTNPPFTAWSNTTVATAGGKVYYRSAGDVNVIDNLGNIIIIGANEGKWAFTIDTIDSGGTLTKIDNTVMYRIDSGMYASVQTDAGVFYVNKEGLWQLTSVGQSDVRYSDQEQLTSQLLGNTYFDDATLDQAYLVSDDKRNSVYLTYKNSSDQNNAILVYNTELKAFSTFKGWNMTRFVKIDDLIYASGSLKAEIWETFSGYDDDGTDIYTRFLQEINVGGLANRKEILGQYFQGFLSQSTEINVSFDIYDKDGVFVDNKMDFTWDASGLSGGTDGYGVEGWGLTGWGVTSVDPGLIESFVGARGRIKNFQRIRIDLTCNDKIPHSVNWFSVQTKDKAPIRNRKLLQN